MELSGWIPSEEESDLGQQTSKGIDPPLETPIKYTPVTGRISRAKNAVPVHTCNVCRPVRVCSWYFPRACSALTQVDVRQGGAFTVRSQPGMFYFDLFGDWYRQFGYSDVTNLVIPNQHTLARSKTVTEHIIELIYLLAISINSKLDNDPHTIYGLDKLQWNARGDYL